MIPTSTLLKITLGLSLLPLVACSPRSESLATQRPLEQPQVEIPHYDMPPAQRFDWVTEDGGQSQLDFNPKIDILFIVDNSDSMKSTQDNIRRNISHFTAGILKNRMIDFHIGVVSTWDNTERARSTKKDPYDIGELRHIRDSKGKIYDQRFLSRKISTPEVIASTIHIGVAPYKEGGPEIEEFFTPLIAALKKSIPGQPNEGFLRDEAQLVVIIVTDAEDAGNSLSPEQVVHEVRKFKNHQADKIAVYGVLVRAEDPDDKKDWALRIHPQYNEQCFNIVKGKSVNNGTCSPFGPKLLEEFIVKANDRGGSVEDIKRKYILPLVSPDYGTELARIGNEITVKTLEKEIRLSQRPKWDSKTQLPFIRVRYGKPEDLANGGGQLIPIGEKGWIYNPENNSVLLSGHIEYNYVEGARFAVDMIPLTLKL